jgi:hypothetical protein
MNRDDIIRMALEAGFSDREESSHIYSRSRFDEEICVEEFAVGEMVEHFAKLVAAHERDKCYQIAMSEASSGSLYGWPECAHVIAKAIRARGEV